MLIPNITRRRRLVLKYFDWLAIAMAPKKRPPPKLGPKKGGSTSSILKFTVPLTLEQRMAKLRTEQEKVLREADERRAQFYSDQIRSRTNQHFTVEKLVTHMEEIRRDFADSGRVISDQDLFGEIVRNLEFVEVMGGTQPNLLNFPEYVKPDLLPTPADLLSSYEVTLTNEEIKERKIRELLRANNELLELIDTRHGAPRQEVEQVELNLFDPQIEFDLSNYILPSDYLPLMEGQTDIVDQSLNFNP